MSSSLITRLLDADPIVITGSGAVSCAGAGAKALWAAVRAGVPGGRSCSAGAWRGAAASAGLLPPQLLAGKVDRSVHMALLAAQEAWCQAGVTAEPERVAIVAGTSRGPHGVWEKTEHLLAAGRRIPPRMATAGTVASLSGAIALALGARGPGGTVSATCASGAAAIAAGAELLLLERADCVIAGGADAPLSEGVLAGMESAGLLAAGPDPALACRPFDRRRNGLLPGEGAGFVVMERYSTAAARGARILGFLRGWASCTEPQGRAGIDADGHGLADTMAQAMAMAGLAPAAIEYLNAHGTGTRLNDAAEAAAIARVFGNSGPLPAISSTKAVTGHCLGASPALEAILCLRALQDQWMPGSVNAEQPEYALPLVPPQGQAGRLHHVLSASLGFWGYHAVLVFGR